MAMLLECLAQASSRPRYAFMLLNLIAEVADSQGKAGPFVRQGNRSESLRDWLGDSLAPMGNRDPRRLALAERVRDELTRAGTLPPGADEARAVIDREVRDRVRASAKTNLSRAVSELVKAGLLLRHYAGYRVYHHNRGGQRHVVYTLVGQARCLLGRAAPMPARPSRQGELAFA
ncbi:MAG: hypothetical protein M0R03_06865 [Novosphingobium sp.]|nr:hypothetical protein [Novosphingobium sp.]